MPNRLAINPIKTRGISYGSISCLYNNLIVCDLRYILHKINPNNLNNIYYIYSDQNHINKILNLQI